MPEPSGRNRRYGVVWSMSNAHEAGQLALISCGHCNIKRYYQPGDLQTVFGNVGIDDIPGKMRCTKCGLRDYIRASFESLPAVERQKIHVRHLAEIRMVRKVIWRDD